MTLSEIRERALEMQAQLDAMDDGTWPPAWQAIVDRCRADLAVVIAASDEDLAALLEAGGCTTFDALRGVLRPV